MSHTTTYLDEVVDVASRISHERIEELARNLLFLRENKGRLFIFGMGGSQANACHAVNDFRKLCGIEAYTPDFSEFSARVNDEGLESTFLEWLKVSNPTPKDAILVLSVGGGSTIKGISMNLVSVMHYCLQASIKIFGIVGKDGGYAGIVGKSVVVVPEIKGRVTPHTEAFQMVVLHCLVSHPMLQRNPTKWQ